MKDFLLPYEDQLFLLINGSRSYFMDCVMWLYSGRVIWIPVVAFIVFILVYKKNWKEWLGVLLSVTLVITLCDQIGADFIKPLVGRPRPVNFPGIMEHVITVNGYGENLRSSGFISNHAANAFAFATFSSLIFRNRAYNIIIFSWAVIMAYSRVYLGVHFVSDVLGGMIFGMGIAYAVYKLYLLLKKHLSAKYETLQLALYPRERINILSISILSYIAAFTMLSTLLIEINLFK